MDQAGEIALAVATFDAVWNQQNRAAVATFFASNYVIHDSAQSDLPVGTHAFQERLAAYHAAVPDLYFTVDTVVADGDRVLVHWLAEGRRREACSARTPDQEQARVFGYTMYRFAGEVIVEAWVCWQRVPDARSRHDPSLPAPLVMPQRL